MDRAGLRTSSSHCTLEGGGGGGGHRDRRGRTLRLRGGAGDVAEDREEEEEEEHADLHSMQDYHLNLQSELNSAIAR